MNESDCGYVTVLRVAKGLVFRQTVAFGAALFALTISVVDAQPSPGVSSVTSDAPAAEASPNDLDAGAVVDRIAKKVVPVSSPGLAIAVVRDGRLETARGYGLANLQRKTNVTPETRFEIGSITKQFTAACVLQLARAGKLSLDDALGKYVPSYRRGREVTLRELLGQTSGIPEYLDSESVAAEAVRPTTFGGLMALVAPKPLLFKPGKHWAYSNTNYILLGQVIAVVSGESYENYVRGHVFGPAGMTNSGFIGDATDPDSTALGYEFEENTTEKRLLREAPQLDESWIGAAGGIVSTLVDMAAWDAALASGRVLSTRDVALLRTTGTLLNGSRTRYAFGWIVDDVEGHTRLWHNGGTFGYHAVNAVFPNDGLAIIVFANEPGAPVEDFATDVFLKLTPDAAERRATVDTNEDLAVTARVREWIGRMQTGQIDRSQLTDDMNKTFTAAVTGDTMEQFAAFGALERLVFKENRSVQEATTYTYLAEFASTTLTIKMAIDANTKIKSLSFDPS